MSSRGWDLPVYVTNVDADGVVGKEGSIRKGRRSASGSLPLVAQTHDLRIITRLPLLCSVTRKKSCFGSIISHFDDKVSLL